MASIKNAWLALGWGRTYVPASAPLDHLHSPEERSFAHRHDRSHHWRPHSMAAGNSRDELRGFDQGPSLDWSYSSEHGTNVD
jgi:hypothetical protein